MFNKIKGGTKYNVAGLECWVPPPPKEKSKILFSHLPKKEQYWRREPLPDYWYELRPTEREIQEQQFEEVLAGKRDKVTHYDPILEAYRREQWRRRIYGVHIMVNGEVIYLTGLWWFYLQWCKFDHDVNDGYPLFYMSQRDRFYFRQYCQEDPNCLGYIMLGPRGFGKSSEEISAVLESITREPRRKKAALQSKSFDDAKKVLFKGKLVPAYKALPEFFQPNSNHGTNPERHLSFSLDAKRGQKAKDIKGIDLTKYELENVAYYVSAKEKALDGTTMGELIQDEIGKTNPKEEANVYDRMNVNRFCVYRNDRKVGMIRAISTVEEMDSGGRECKMIWEESDQSKRTSNGFTISGLYRMGVTVLYTATQFADVYGVIDRDKAMAYHINARKDREHDRYALASWIRKNPLYENEFFITDAGKSLFNVYVLTERLQELYSMKRHPYLRGNFYWVDGKVDGLVDFRIDPDNGRFLVSKLLDVKKGRKSTDGNTANNVSYYVMADGKKQWMPGNNRFYRMSSDPIKYSRTKDPRASKMAMHGFELYNPAIDNGVDVKEWQTHNVIFEYIHRPQDPEIAYEDCIMAMRYYGCSILIETNIKELVQHLHQRGYSEFIIHRQRMGTEFIGGKQMDDGLTSNSEVIHAYTTRIISFINKHGHRLKFPRTIEQLLEFDPTNTTKFDAVVSFGYVLMASEIQLEDDTEVEDVNDWFDEYDESGVRGSLLEAF